MNEPEAMAGSTYQGAELTSQEQDGDLDMRFSMLQKALQASCCNFARAGTLPECCPSSFLQLQLRQLGALGIWGSY